MQRSDNSPVLSIAVPLKVGGSSESAFINVLIETRTTSASCEAEQTAINNRKRQSYLSEGNARQIHHQHGPFERLQMKICEMETGRANQLFSYQYANNANVIQQGGSFIVSVSVKKMIIFGLFV